MTRSYVPLLIVLSLLWGASYLFIKVGVREFEPTAMMLLRVVIAGAILCVYLASQGLLGELREAPFGAYALGVLNSSLPFTFIAWGEKHVDSGTAAVANATVPIFAITWAETRLDSGLTAAIQAAAPIFTALLAVWFSKREQVNGLRLVGLVIGFGGVALLVGAQPSGHVAAGLAVVFSAFCYAVAALYTATRLRGIPPLVIALGTLTAASLATLPPGLFFLPDHATGWKVTASVLTLGIAGTGIAYILYYAILTGAGASRGILITYLVPAFALVYGVVLLDEPLSAAAVGGLALVLLGVALGTGALRLRRRRETAASLPL